MWPHDTLYVHIDHSRLKATEVAEGAPTVAGTTDYGYSEYYNPSFQPCSYYGGYAYPPYRYRYYHQPYHGYGNRQCWQF